MTRLVRAAVAVAAILALSVPPPPAALAGTSTPQVQTFMDGLAFPTNMAFAPDGRLFFNEKETGRIRIIKDGQLLPAPFATLPVDPSGESGLLGLALDPDFANGSPFVYVYYTSSVDGRNHVARIRANGDTGGPPENLLTLLTASGIHNGGDITFGPDGKLYVVAGETGNSDLAQDLSSLGGKVLRLNRDGSIPFDNPFGRKSPVFSFGHRNSFGLCFDPATGELWETENGPDRDDEVNRIEAGKNYGWPHTLGPGSDPRFVNPVLVFRTVIVPTGCTFYDRALEGGDPAPAPGSQLIVGDFHGDLLQVQLQAPGDRLLVTERKLVGLDEGITDVEEGPDHALYIATQSSIRRIAGLGGVSATPPPTPAPGPFIKPQAHHGIGLVTVIVIAAAVLLVSDGMLVVWIRRRRARARGPGRGT